MARLLQRAAHLRGAHVVPVLSEPRSSWPRLLADIGGTHARFAIARAPGAIEDLRVLPCARFASLYLATRTYLASVGEPRPRHGALAIAGPVDGDAVRMTNHAWRFSVERQRELLDMETLLAVNDVAAAAIAAAQLSEGERERIGGVQSRPRGPLCVIGPGTGLGVAALVRCNGRWSVVASEGGHGAFSPADPVEAGILRFAWSEHHHVSSERLISGPGIELIHRASRAEAGLAPLALDTGEIVRRARAGECALCALTLSRFSAMLGTFAANAALTFGARGGVYIAGGVVRRMGAGFDRALFRARFEANGRFHAYLARIPTLLITREYPALHGPAAMLSTALRERGPQFDRL
jgi:glucokinase